MMPYGGMNGRSKTAVINNNTSSNDTREEVNVEGAQKETIKRGIVKKKYVYPMTRNTMET